MFKKKWMVQCRFPNGVVELLPSRRFRTEKRARQIADLAEVYVFEHAGYIVEMTPVLMEGKKDE